MSYKRRLDVAEMIELNASGIFEVDMGVDEYGNTLVETDEFGSCDFLVVVDNVLKPHPSIYDCVGTKDAEYRDETGRVARCKVSTLSQSSKGKWVGVERLCVLSDEDFMTFSSLATEGKEREAINFLKQFVPEECGMSPQDRLLLKEEETMKKPTIVDFSALGADIPEPPKDAEVGSLHFFKPEKPWEVARFVICGNEINVKGILKKSKGSFKVDVLNAYLNKKQLDYVRSRVMISFAKRGSSK